MLVHHGPWRPSARSRRHRLIALGPAFFTNYMFFADPGRWALVLDEYGATWLRQHAEVKLRVYRARSWAYRDNLTLAPRLGDRTVPWRRMTSSS